MAVFFFFLADSRGFLANLQVGRHCYIRGNGTVAAFFELQETQVWTMRFVICHIQMVSEVFKNNGSRQTQVTYRESHLCIAIHCRINSGKS